MIILYGKHAVSAALQNPRRFCKTLFVKESFKDQKWLDEIIATCPQKKQPIIKTLNVKQFEEKIEEGSVHQGIALEADHLPQFSLDQFLKDQESKEILNVLILDQVTDPQNLGAIIRSAAAFNFDAVIISGQKNSLLKSPVLFKTASGAAEIIPLIEVSNLKQSIEKLKTIGIWVYGLDERGKVTAAQTDLKGRVALVLGAEGSGLRRLTKETCDGLIMLPTGPDFFTINVSATAAIVCYETNRQNNKR